MYSNCLIEAIKAKIKNWSEVEIHKIPAKFENQIFPHFWWSEGEKAFDFKCDNPKTKLQVLFFKGHIRESKKYIYENNVNKLFSKYVAKMECKYGKVTEFETSEDLKAQIKDLSWKEGKPTGDENWVSIVYFENKIKSAIIQVKDFEKYRVLRWKYENILIENLEIELGL